MMGLRAESDKDSLKLLIEDRERVVMNIASLEQRSLIERMNYGLVSKKHLFLLGVMKEI